ncbi:MAG TPA: hypothetical protein VFA47_04695 [Candidatus Manganitrophaceae bacterium]|nr:hypothetical protein [Candidatus Manganitrophaceae bacterium]
MEPLPDRRGEWFVPSFGPLRFRLWVGLLFLPYTGMVVSYTVVGGMLAEKIDWTRVGAVALIYFLGLGVAAHALDAIGGEGAKPWGRHFSRKELWIAALAALIPAYGVGIYYIVTATPRLAVIALLEGFFLFAYNLEWFGGRFHTDGWFAFSWGCLPVLAGYLIQTNTLSTPSLFAAGAMGLLSLVEINASRPYKALKRTGGIDSGTHLKRYEAILKNVSFGVILLAAGMAVWRWGF